MEEKYYQIIKKNRELGAELLHEPKVSIGVFSNIIVSQLKEVLEYELRQNKINAYVNNGDYNNIVQNSMHVQPGDNLLYIWDLTNIIDGFYYKSEVLSENELNDIVENTKHQIDLVLSNCKDNFVLFTSFSSLVFTHSFYGRTNYDKCAKDLNDYLFSRTNNRVFIIDIDKIITRIGIDEAINLRDFYSSKSLYTVRFYKYLAKILLPVFRSLKGMAKKALILDCDNTLWKGIVGEDGPSLIQMSSGTREGIPFEEFQYLVKYLAKRGVIIGLNSKNNENDVAEILNKHPHFVLKNDIVIKKINWQNKASNIQEIVQELNIGIDSIVFVDDSDFEISIVNKMLPEVETFQVADTSSFPWRFREVLQLFFNISTTGEDLKRAKLYKDQFSRKQEEDRFLSIDDFLKSLKLQLLLNIDDKENVARIAQLSQKTNQFNLTTIRYSEQDILTFMNSSNSFVYSISVSDKFGDMGITGVAIVKCDFKDSIAEIDSFLMSCRIIGRNIEFKFINEIVQILSKLNIKKINGCFSKTIKNEQVRDFYDKIGFVQEKNMKIAGNRMKYSISVAEFTGKDVEFIKMNYGNKN